MTYKQSPTQVTGRIGLHAKLSLTAIAAVLALTSPLPAIAQVIEEITVTARKRDENIQDIPLAITAITESALRDNNINSIDDVARFTPGFSFSQGFGRATERPVVRGAANILAGVQFGVEAGTAYFIDGQYYSGDIASLDLNQIQRVEIVKGPQSALFGRNSYAGAINFITRAPADTFVGQASAELTDKRTDLYGYVSGPLSDNGRGSISIRKYEYEGSHRNHDGTLLGSEETLSFNARADFDFADNVSISMRFGFTDDDDGPRAFALLKSDHNNCMAGYRSNLYRGSVLSLPTTATMAQTDALTGYNNRDDINAARMPIDIAATNLAAARTALAAATDATRTAAEADVTTAQTELNTANTAQAMPLATARAAQKEELDIALAGTNEATYNDNQYFCGEIPATEIGTQDLNAAPFIGVQRQLVTFATDISFGIGNEHEAIIRYALRDEDRRTGADSDHQEGGLYFGRPGTVNSLFGNDQLDTTRDHSLEFIVKSPQDQRVRWLTGAYYYDYRTQNTDYTYGDANASGTLDEISEIKNTALFGAIDFDMVESLTGSFELRYAEEEKVLRDIADDATYLVSYDTLAPRFVINYAINENYRIYGGIAQGSKAGGSNGAAGAADGNPAYDTEEVTAIEFGSKLTWLDGRLNTNAALYFNQIEDYQATRPIGDQAASNSALTSIAVNAGDVDVLGLEVQLQYLPTDNMSFGFTYAYTDSEFKRGCDADQFTLTSGGFDMSSFDINNEETWNQFRNSNDGGATPSNDPDGRYEAGAGDCSIAGKRVPLTSEHQFSAQYRIGFDINGDVQGFFNTNVTYESSKFVQVHNLAETGDSWIVGAQVGFTTDDWTIRLIGTNLTDDDTVPVATRWFDVLQGSSNTGTDANSFRSGCGSSSISCGSPRGVFRSFRKGREIGLKVSRTF